MSNQTWKNTFLVGRYICEMTLTLPDSMSAEWRPEPPKPKGLNKSEMKQYRAGRDALLQEVALAIGGNVLVVEL